MPLAITSNEYFTFYCDTAEVETAFQLPIYSLYMKKE